MHQQKVTRFTSAQCNVVRNWLTPLDGVPFTWKKSGETRDNRYEKERKQVHAHLPGEIGEGSTRAYIPPFNDNVWNRN